MVPTVASNRFGCLVQSADPESKCPRCDARRRERIRLQEVAVQLLQTTRDANAPVISKYIAAYSLSLGRWKRGLKTAVAQSTIKNRGIATEKRW